MQFFQLGGRTMNTDQARKWRAEQTRLEAIFCDYCISKAVRHTKECKTREEGFSEATPKLTKEERENLIKQKDEPTNQGKTLNTQLVATEGELHGDDNQDGHREETLNNAGGNEGSGDEVGERNGELEHVKGEGK